MRVLFRNSAGTAGPTSTEASLQQPTYQNQRVVHETVTTTTTSSSGRGGKGSSSLNNNLSELDTLLQDLSSARYASASSYDQRRVCEDWLCVADASLVNGSVGAHPQRPPSAQDGARARPSVDSLLDELSAPNGDLAGPPRPPPPAGGSHTTVHSVDYSTTTTYGGSPASASASASGASTATKELDLLMASLADFKITASSHQHQTVTDSPYAKPNKATKSSPSPQPPPAAASPAPLVASAAPASHAAHPQPPAGSAPKQNQLDSMLGNLQADMSRQGVNTTQKGCCNACDKPIVGQVITALGKTWHPEHFTCNHCNQELGTRNFFERDGHPYCEPDYHNLFSPRCAYCNGPILDKCVTALEKTWHTEHFFCAQCGKQFGEEGFHEKDGKPYCRDDYFDMFAPKCGACNRPIMENYISALNSQWHADCFVCRDCKKAVQGKSFYAMEGKPVCPKCVGVDEDEDDE
ncbi:LIM domain-containing protein jub [Gryllus bimaculatus]|nr:LIM domain-containing protein jub [Gryllus bimaculatus]